MAQTFKEQSAIAVGCFFFPCFLSSLIISLSCAPGSAQRARAGRFDGVRASPTKKLYYIFRSPRLVPKLCSACGSQRPGTQSSALEIWICRGLCLLVRELHRSLLSVPRVRARPRDRSLLRRLAIDVEIYGCLRSNVDY